MKYCYKSFKDGTPASGYWDMTLLQDIFDACGFTEVAELEDYGILVITGRNHADKIKEVNEYITKLSGVVVVVVGDEESIFPVNELQHRNMKVWYMTPKAGEKYPNVDRFLGSGYSPHVKQADKSESERIYRFCFSGQVTHSRREQAYDVISRLEGGYFQATDGFTRGLTPPEYVELLKKSKVVVCPCGAFSPDSFRVYEALEMGCIPLIDSKSSNHPVNGYWKMIFGEANLPYYNDAFELPDLINYFNDTFEESQKRIMEIWNNYKKELKNALIEHTKIIACQKLRF